MAVGRGNGNIPGVRVRPGDTPHRSRAPTLMGEKWKWGNDRRVGDAKHGPLAGFAAAPARAACGINHQHGESRVWKTCRVWDDARHVQGAACAFAAAWCRRPQPKTRAQQQLQGHWSHRGQQPGRRTVDSSTATQRGMTGTARCRSHCCGAWWSSRTSPSQGLLRETTGGAACGLCRVSL